MKKLLIFGIMALLVGTTLSTSVNSQTKEMDTLGEISVDPNKEINSLGNHPGSDKRLSQKTANLPTEGSNGAYHVDLEWTGGYGRNIGYKGKGFETADLDGDTNREIIFLSSPGYWINENYITIVKSCIYIIECENGNYLDVWRSSDFTTSLTCLDVADVDQDSVPEIVVGGQAHRILIFDGASHVLEWESDDFEDVINDLDIADVDIDGEMEIVASIGTELFIINGVDHSIEWQSEGLDLSGSVVHVADVDVDLQPEILLGTFEWINGRLYIFDGLSPDLLQWRSPALDDEINSIWVSDVDSDGGLEIIIGSSDTFEGYVDAGVHVYDALTHELEWKKPDSTEGTSCVAVSEDLDQDGTQEITISETTAPYGGFADSYIHIYDGITHELEWQENVGVEWRYGPHSPWINDIDNDGVNELLIGRGRGSIHVLNGESYVEEWESWYPGARAWQVRQVEMVDVDGDKSIEIVVGTLEGYVYVLNGTSREEEWRSNLLANTPYDSLIGMVIMDVDNDLTNEIVVGMETYTGGCPLFDGILFVFDGITHELEWYSGYLGYHLTALNVGDVDDDGIVEFITGDHDGFLYGYNGISHELEWKTKSFPDGIDAISIDDVDLDGEMEIVIGTGSWYEYHFVFILDGRTQRKEWKSKDYRQTIMTITTSNVDDDDAVEVLFSIQSGEVFVIDGVSQSTEWISDDLGIDVYGLAGENVDPDGVIEIVVGSESGIYAFDGITHRQEWHCENVGANGLSAMDIDDDEKVEIIGGDYGYLHILETTGEPNNAPNKPNRPSGSKKGKVGESYTYTTSSTEPDGDKIYYKWDWDDGCSEWLGPYYSGDNVHANHTWKKIGFHQIRVKAKDNYGCESEWSDPLSIIMPKNKPFNFNFNLLQWLFERFPNAFPILRLLKGLT